MGQHVTGTGKEVQYGVLRMYISEAKRKEVLSPTDGDKVRRLSAQSAGLMPKVDV